MCGRYYRNQLDPHRDERDSAAAPPDRDGGHEVDQRREGGEQEGDGRIGELRRDLEDRPRTRGDREHHVDDEQHAPRAVVDASRPRLAGSSPPQTRVASQTCVVRSTSTASVNPAIPSTTDP